MNTEKKPKLKIVTPVENILLPYYDIPYCTIKKTKFDKKEKEKVIKIRTKSIGYSAYKLNDVCRMIRKKSIHFALDITNGSSTKGAELVKKTIESFLDKLKLERQNREDRGIVTIEDNHFKEWEIAEAYVGKKKGISIPHQRAKGRMFMITKPITWLNLVLRRVDGVEAYQKVLLGKSDPTFAYSIRQYLFLKNATLRELNNYSFITTSKGRFYRRVQFGRLITLLRERLHKKHGILLAREVIENHLKKDLGFSMDPKNPRSQYYNIIKLANLSGSEKLKKLVEEKLNIDIKESSPMENDFKERQANFNSKMKKF
jgi:ribosomal protein L22